MILPTACTREAITPETSSGSPALAADQADLTGVYNRNRAVITENLNLITLGMTRLMSSPGFAALVRDEAALQAVDGDYAVTFSTLIQRCQAVNHDLPLAMQTSLGLCGGTSAEQQKLLQVMQGFSVEGIPFTPVLFFPQLDAAEFPSLNWNGTNPAYVSHIEARHGNRLRVWDAAGAMAEKTETQVRDVPVWFVSFAYLLQEEAGGPGPILRPFEKCNCLKGNPVNGQVTVECRTGQGSPTGQGACGRSNLFGRNCSGSCTGTSPTH